MALVSYIASSNLLDNCGNSSFLTGKISIRMLNGQIYRGSEAHFMVSCHMPWL